MKLISVMLHYKPAEKVPVALRPPQIKRRGNTRRNALQISINYRRKILLWITYESGISDVTRRLNEFRR